MVREAGVEPARSFPRQILSLVRLPFRHSRCMSGGILAKKMKKIMHEKSNLLWNFLSGISLLAIDFYIISYGIRTETPVLNFPLLFLLHSLAIFVVLPSVLFIKIPFRKDVRKGAFLIFVGGFTLLLGFLFVPRSLVVAESGLMVLIGVWIIKKIFNKQNFSGFSLGNILFWGFFLTILTGILLGLTLARPMIDPIPFRGILLHGFTGIAFTLTAFSVIFPRNNNLPLSDTRKIWASFLYLIGITCLFTVPLIKNIQFWIILSLFLLLLALLTGYQFLHDQSCLGILFVVGGIMILLSSGWKASPGPSMTFFLLMWLYFLGGMSLSQQNVGKVTGTIGTSLFLFGVWDSQKEFLYIGFLVHFITLLSVVTLPYYSETRSPG